MMLDQDLHHQRGVWIQLLEDRIHLMNPDGSIIATQMAQPPYANERSIIANFDAASGHLCALMQKAQRKWFQSPITLLQVIQQEELTPLEQRALLELAYNCTHAREVRLYDAKGRFLPTDTTPPALSSPVLRYGLLFGIVLLFGLSLLL